MKLRFSILALFCVTSVAMSQKGLPAFGKIEISDLELKDCPFDPGADAFKLIDWGNMYFTHNPDEGTMHNIMYERRVRIKILKDAGLSYANLFIPFYSNNNDEKILKLDACTYNLEGKKIKKTIIYKNAVYTKKINKQYSEMILAFPEVKPGSVIEYKYLMQRKTIADIKDWYFQSNIPTKFSEYQVRIPQAFRFAIQPLVADPIEMKEREYTDHAIVKGNIVNTTGMQKNFIMRNLPAIRNEPYMGAARDYLQRLSFQLSGIDYGGGNALYIRGDWDDVVSELTDDPDFGGQLNKKITDASGIIANANELAGLETRMVFIYNYVKKHLDWNGLETIYSYQGLKSAFLKKSGSSADINLLLIALLKQAGVYAVPVIFSTRNNGLVNTALPFINQFNTVMALVQVDKKYYILDGTDKYSAYNLMPDKIVNTKGFIIETGNGRWLEAMDSVHKYKVTTAVRGAIDTSGIMKGDILITSSGYARKQRLEEWIDQKGKFNTGYLNPGYDALQVDGPEMENLEADTLPLEQKLKFSMKVSNTGELFYFKLNLFAGLEKNRFIASERRTDIDFGYQQEYMIYGNYTIPGDYVFEDIPPNLSLIMPDTSIVFRRFITAENNSLNVRISIDFKRPWYAAGEYPEFTAFYKILLSRLNEQVTIKKKGQQ